VKAADSIREGTDRLPKKVGSFVPIWLHKVRLFAKRQPQRLATGVQKSLASEFPRAGDETCEPFRCGTRRQAPGEDNGRIFGALREEISAGAFEFRPFGGAGRRTRLKNFRNVAVVFHDFQIRARRLPRS
jgi:hypothetical protein